MRIMRIACWKIAQAAVKSQIFQIWFVEYLIREIVQIIWALTMPIALSFMIWSNHLCWFWLVIKYLCNCNIVIETSGRVVTAPLEVWNCVEGFVISATVSWILWRFSSYIFVPSPYSPRRFKFPLGQFWRALKRDKGILLFVLHAESCIHTIICWVDGGITKSKFWSRSIVQRFEVKFIECWHKPHDNLTIKKMI